MSELKNIYFTTEGIAQGMALLSWYTLARHITPCPECGTFLTSLWFCSECGKRYELIEKPAEHPKGEEHGRI